MCAFSEKNDISHNAGCAVCIAKEAEYSKQIEILSKFKAHAISIVSMK